MFDLSDKKQLFTMEYNLCVVNCPPGDFVCIGVCARDFEENKQRCPCQQGCPNGCPCPDFHCPTTPPTTTLTTTAMTTPAVPKKSVLVLNSFETRKATITDAYGKEEYPLDDFMFLYGEGTEVYFSCSVSWHGQVIFYGGYSVRNQISKLNGCKLERIGTLHFDLYGGCGNFNEEEIYLCFSSYSVDVIRCVESLINQLDNSKI